MPEWVHWRKLAQALRLSGFLSTADISRNGVTPALCRSFGGSPAANLHHPQVIGCAGLAEWNAGDYHD
jgi:hypothetical protein